MPPTPAEPWPAHEFVEPAAHLPEHIAGIPAIPPSDPADCCVDTRRIRGDVHDPLVGEDGAPCPNGVSRYGPRHAPVGLHRVPVDLHLRAVDCLANAQSMVWHQALGGVVGDDHAIFKPLSQRPRDPVGDRGDQIDPQ